MTNISLPEPLLFPHGKLSTNDPKQLLMPNLFIIGASKSGSSALHAYLKPHPSIAMGTEKEPCFFVDPKELKVLWPVMAQKPCSHDWDSYLNLWDGKKDAVYRGEGSTLYSQAPHCSNVPARIHAVSPEARIIYIVREPVRRAIVHYWQDFKEFREALPMEQAVKQHSVYRDTSDYAMQIERFLEYFDRSQIHIVVAEELRTKRRAVVAEVVQWLGLLPYEHNEAELTERHRSPLQSRKERFPLVRQLRDSVLWQNLRDYVPTSVLVSLRKTATVEFDKSAIDETAARTWLENYLAPRKTAFEALLGRRVDAWK